MKAKIFSNSKSSNQKVLKIYQYVIENKESKNWELRNNLELHNLLMDLSKDDFDELVFSFSFWNTLEQNIVSDCVAYGIDGKYNPLYTNEKRLAAQKLYSKMKKGFSHPELKKWKKDYRVHSKTKSNNLKVLELYNHLLKYQYWDSDYWTLGGGNQELLTRLTGYNEIDWEDLNKDIINWSLNDKDILIEALSDEYEAYYFRDNGVLTIYVGYFLMDLYEKKMVSGENIGSFAYVMLESNFLETQFLKEMKGWLIKNGFEHGWDGHPWNPIEHINTLLNKNR